MLPKKLKQAVKLAIGGTIAFSGICLYSGNEQFYQDYAMPLFRLLEPELAHNLAVKLAKYNFGPRQAFVDTPVLKTEIGGLKFSNPIGLAAGFDKDAACVPGMLAMGFGFVEIGSVTPLPQPGNDRPRIFRLVEDKAIINRYGFNSVGHDAVARNLENLSEVQTALLGVNLGKNKTSPDGVEDYVKGVRRLGRTAAYVVINISSPNTPGLRNLQAKDELGTLIDKVVEERNRLSEKSPLILIKIAPDLSEQDRIDIANVVNIRQKSVGGLIISNSTVKRPSSLISQNKSEVGGLTGGPLNEMSTDLVREMYILTNGKVPIIGVGGVSSGQDAYDKIRAGASAVQLYTALVYEGPPVVTRIKKELSELLSRDGFSCVREAVGFEHRKSGDTAEF